MVEASLTVAGTIDDYPNSTIDYLESKFAGQAGVDSSNVAVTLYSASVLIVVRVTTDSSGGAESVMSSLSLVLSNSTAATRFLSSPLIDVNVLNTTDISTVVVPAPSQPPTP